MVFIKIMDPDKWDITLRYRVTRYPRVFSKLAIGQLTPEFWGVIVHIKILGANIHKGNKIFITTFCLYKL